MLIVVSGPEKAGKTTFCHTLVSEAHSRNIQAEYRHWGPIPKTLPNGLPGDTRYLEALQKDVKKAGIVVWDRSWACEYAYGIIPGQDDHRLALDPWLGEWIYSRAVQSMGLRMMLLGPDPETLARKRTPDDLPIDPEVERERYRAYGQWYGWDVVENPHTDVFLDNFVKQIIDLYEERHRRVQVPPPPVYCGPYRASVVVVGERRNDRLSISNGQAVPGGWLPFTSLYTEKYGRALGTQAFQVGWTNTWDILELVGEANPLSHAATIITCGRIALDYAAAYFPSARIIPAPHPSAVYRWGKWKDRVLTVEMGLKAAVRKYAPEHTLIFREQPWQLVSE